VFFLLSFGSVTIDEIRIGGRGNVNVNSPFAILQTLAIMSVFAIFIVTAFVANVVIRDDETGFAPIMRGQLCPDNDAEPIMPDIMRGRLQAGDDIP
jgi:hypothetical protein